MNEGLELLKYFGFDDETFGATLALVARCQGSSVSAIIANLEASEQAGSAQARDTLSFYRRADSALQQMADADRTARLHGGPGGEAHRLHAKPGGG
jgi:hypothetical protein